MLHGDLVDSGGGDEHWRKTGLEIRLNGVLFGVDNAGPGGKPSHTD